MVFNIKESYAHLQEYVNKNKVLLGVISTPKRRNLIQDQKKNHKNQDHWLISLISSKNHKFLRNLVLEWVKMKLIKYSRPFQYKIQHNTEIIRKEKYQAS